MEKARSLHDAPDDDIEMHLILVWTVVVLNAMAFHEEIIAKRSVMVWFVVLLGCTKRSPHSSNPELLRTTPTFTLSRVYHRLHHQ